MCLCCTSPIVAPHLLFVLCTFSGAPGACGTVFGQRWPGTQAAQSMKAHAAQEAAAGRSVRASETTTTSSSGTAARPAFLNPSCRAASPKT
jgi:hypothetical protein